MTPKTETPSLGGLDRKSLLEIYRAMLLSRKIDDKEIQLKRQNKIYFQINGVGHEAVGAAIGAGVQARPRLVLLLLPGSRRVPRARD